VVSPVPAANEEQVTLYFPHRSRPVLVREVRQVERRGEQPEWLAVQQLLAGPRSPEARPLFAVITREAPVAISVKVIAGNVTLLLTRPAAAALAEGGDLLPIYALVNTLGSYPQVESVSFRLEGQAEGPVIAGTDLSRPMKPRWDLVETEKHGYRK
jgi:spore germination protein GerM